MCGFLVYSTTKKYMLLLLTAAGPNLHNHYASTSSNVHNGFRSRHPSFTVTAYLFTVTLYAYLPTVQANVIFIQLSTEVTPSASSILCFLISITWIFVFNHFILTNYISFLTQVAFRPFLYQNPVSKCVWIVILTVVREPGHWTY